MDPISGSNVPPPKAGEKARIEAVAKELEGVFLRSLLSHARGVDLDQDGVFAKSAAVDQFQELLHGQLAERASGGLGIADLVVQHLTRSKSGGGASHD
jgi:Rod binding domain-containing protein